MWSSRALAICAGAGLALIAIAALMVHVVFDVPLGRPITGVELSLAGLILQAAALVIGVVVINLASHARARGILIVQGIVCLLAYGPTGGFYVLLLVACWFFIGGPSFGIGRLVMAVGLIVSFAARDPANALVFSLLFGMRLIVFAYDRWQNQHQKVTLGDFLVYVMPAPLVVIVPYMAIIPLFDRHSARLSFGLTREKLQLIGSQLVLAAIAGGLYAAASCWEPTGIAAMYWTLLRAVLELAVVAYLALPLLALHGILERSPLDRPLLATRITELWRRFGLHLRDALVFLFYTPALLMLRRTNRYLRIVLAVGWTMVVGNTLLHILVRYAYLDDGWARTWHALLGNGVLAIALALDLCHQEWCRDLPATRSMWRTILGWLITLTVAALALQS